MPRDTPAPWTATRAGPRSPDARRLALRVALWRLRLPVVALCLGLAVAAVVARLTPEPPATARVPVAARALPAGTVLAADDLALRDVPVALVPSGLLPTPAPTEPGAADSSTGSSTDPAVGSTTDPSVDPATGSVTGATADPATSTTAGSVTGTTADATTGPAPPTPPAVDAPTLDALVGRRLAVDVPAGLPLVAGLLVDPDAEPPPGTVVVPVRFADPTLTVLLTPGTRVDVVLASALDGVEPERVARSAVVLARTGTTTGQTDLDTTNSLEDAVPDAVAAAGTDGAGTGTSDGSDAGPVLLAVTPDEAVRLSGATASGVLSVVLVG